MVFVESDTSPVYDIAASITPPDPHTEINPTTVSGVDIASLVVGDRPPQNTVNMGSNLHRTLNIGSNLNRSLWTQG